MSMVTKAIAVIFVLILAFDLYGRWTGKGFSLNVLGQNPIGALANQ